jgi:HTH-type transcriptional regulator / antitoxin HigA
MEIQQWFLIENDSEYQLAVDRYEQVKRASKGTVEHREKRLLAEPISYYESIRRALSEVDPSNLIKINLIH